MNVERSIYHKIKSSLFNNKVVILYGARRTGKTTLIKALCEEMGPNARYINCEDLVNKTTLETTNTESLKVFLGNYKLIALDEAQSVSGIGHILKLLVDTFPQTQIIATGSSSFELANQTGEPLVGRSRTFTLYPLSLQEIINHEDSLRVHAQLDEILRFGLMPSVYGQSEEEAQTEINQIASQYLYKDILIFEGIKKSKLIIDLLRALALQLGSEVSYREIADLIGTSHITVSKYIEILEKSFILFSLPSLSRNPRNEIKRGKKVYFYDLGLRNSLIQNFNPLSLRTDAGALWENFCIVELIKKRQAEGLSYNNYFWRTNSQKEVDYIEEFGGTLHTYEFKISPKKSPRLPLLFAQTYPHSEFVTINRENYLTHLLP